MGEGHRIGVIDRVADVEVTEVDSVSEALLSKQPDQALQAAVQRPAKGRQELPVHQGHAGRRLPAGRAHASWSTTAVFRALRVGDERRRSMNLVRRLFPFRTCTIDIKDGERALQRPCLLYHIKRCQGPHRGDLEGRLPRRHRAGRAVPRGSPGDAGPSAATRCCRPRIVGNTSAPRAPGQDPRHRTDDGEPEDGSLRSDRARPGGWPARTTRPPSLFIIRDGKMIGRDVYLLDAAREASDAEVLTSFLEQYYMRRRSRGRSTCRRP